MGYSAATLKRTSFPALKKMARISRFSEISTVKRLRKRWENKTEQWRTLIVSRSAKLKPQTRAYPAS
jgi:hypothetical protein